MTSQILRSVGLVIALSMDGLILGKAYSSGSPRISSLSYAIVALCTSVLMGISMAFCYLGFSFLTRDVSRFLGGIVFIWIGLANIWHEWRRQANTGNQDGAILLNFRVPIFGVIVQILRDPLFADRDSSGHIDFKEAVFLGLALGLDSFAAGFALSFAGFSFWIVPISGLSSASLVWIGTRLPFLDKTYYVPGILLCLLGFSKIFLK